jgi:hypothetical protein
MSIEGFKNFEVDFAIPSTLASGDEISNIALKSTDVIIDSFSPNGNAQIFAYNKNNKDYLGLLSLNGFTNFSFRKRALEFPQDFQWQKDQKLLHIEGPPQKNTLVSAAVDFAEISVADCRAWAVNSNGGRAAFVDQQNFIVESGNLISVVFDKDMNLPSSLVGTRVKLLDTANNEKTLSFDSSDSRELRFTLGEKLDFDTSYKITVASDVLDANGSQIWADNILSFKTQKATSQVLASEVTSLNVYEDALHTSLIADGSEVNATTTIHLRMTAIDPAFNTVDTALVSVFLNGTNIASITLTQTAAVSTNFDGSYDISAPNGGNNLYEFISPSAAIKTSVRVDYPEITSIDPANGSTNALINEKPVLTFSEPILSSSVNNSTVRLTRAGNPAAFSLSVSGNTITIDPDDSSESYLFTDTTYRIEVGYGIKDLQGNPFYNVPATYTSDFTTQASQTRPVSISAVKLFSDGAYTQQLDSMADFYATGKIYLEFTGADGSGLTKDYAVASISTGDIVNLSETASASAIYRGEFNYSNLGDRFELKVQSVKSPAASASLLITYPRFSPTSPASGSSNIPVNSSIKVLADEAIVAADINATTVKFLLDGVAVSSSRNYNPVTREITITPDALLESEKVYTVSITGLQDTFANPQIIPLIYQFTTEDIIPPTITAFYPAQATTNLTIDQNIVIDFSENILAASVNQTTVKLLRSGTLAGYSTSVSGNRLTIDPDDTAEGYLRTQTGYSLDIGPYVTDLAGNGLSNVPATFTLNFTTQPSITAPASIESLTIFKDPLLLTGWGNGEKVPGSATVYLKVTGVDGATQTKDVATVTLDLSWTSDKQILVRETASNSTGFYIGEFDLGSLPLFGFPTPQPSISIGSLTFFVDQAPANAATLSLTFPALVSAETEVNTLGGITLAAGATDVRADTTITTAFNDGLLDPGNETSLKVTYSGTNIEGNRTLSADRKKVFFNPADPLPYSSLITVSGIYAENGLKSAQGNPIYREFSYSFTTQAAQTQPTSISQVNLFKDDSWSAFSSYATLEDFPGSGTVFIELKGVDGSPNTIDETIAIVSTGDNVTLNETGMATGIYRGSYSYPTQSNGFLLHVASAVTPSASQTLRLSYPGLTQTQPASGAAEISVYTPVYVEADEALDSNTVNLSNIKLLKGGTVETSITVSYNSSLKTIEILPDASLEFSQQYFVSIGNIEDLVGNAMPNSFKSSFTTQATSISPATITGLKAFSDNAYSSQIADNTTLAPQTQCFFEVTAVDLSPTTIDSTSVTMLSSVSGVSSSFVLLETGAATGIFRGSRTLFNEENTTLTISSDADSTFFTRIRTFAYPLIAGIDPASGSTDIFLDTRFVISANKPFDATTVSTGTIFLSDVTGIVSYTPLLSAANQITIYSELQPDSPVSLRITDLVKDTDSIAFPLTQAGFFSVAESTDSLKLFSDAAFTSEIANGSNVESGDVIFARIEAANLYNYHAETADLTYATVLSTGSLSLGEASPGIFQGSFAVPAEPDNQLSVYPDNRPDLKVQLNILPNFAISSFSPASGAVSVPADLWPTWNFTRVVQTADVNNTNFKLTKVSNGMQLNGTLSISPTGKQVRFQPDSILQLLTEYEMSVEATVRDSSGTPLGAGLKTRFTTQPPPAPPTLISLFDNFESDAYATATRAIATNGILYLKLAANDVSFSTYESARVRIDSSDGTFDGLEVNLIEIAPPSGIFTVEIPVNLPVGTTISIQPQVDTSKLITVTAYNRTLLTGISPASATSNLLLDTPFMLNFSQAIDPASILTGIKIFDENQSNIAYSFSTDNSNRNVELVPTYGLATGADHILQISTSLKDANGLFLLPQSLSYSTIGETFAAFEMFTGISPLDNQPVSVTKEVVNGPIMLVASTTNLFQNKAEFRQVVLQAATQTFTLSLSEDSANQGTFASTFTPPTGISTQNLVATLSFSQNPAIRFDIAPQPEILSTVPASGATGISESFEITATFSRRMSLYNADAGLKILHPAGSINTTVQNATDSFSLSWLPNQPLPVQASCSLNFSGLIDYLGQPLPEQSIGFSTGGIQGINLYRDNAFSLLISSNTIDIPVGFAEIAASSTSNLDGRDFALNIRTGTKATSTISLPLSRVASDSGKFRCSLEFASVKAIPQYSVLLLPGEWLELTSPILTNDKKIFYYQQSGAVSPTDIHDLKFFYEKHFAQEISGTLPLGTLYIQIEAEDLNWFTSDTTLVKVKSESDLTGFTLQLTEAGTHSNFFRGYIVIDPHQSDAGRNRLAVQPDQLIYVESVTDPSIKSSIRYLPQNGLNQVVVFPSPARGNSVFFNFYLNFMGEVELEIYDTAGHEVDTRLINAKEGENRFEWRIPRHLANGVYFYVMKLTDSTAYPKAKRKARGKFAVLR